jgi:hypothetical protein
MRQLSPGTLLFAGFAIPTAAYAALYGTVPGFRTFVRNNNPRLLTLVQTPRIVGAVMFGYKFVQGAIPARYGLTTALCDLTIGTTAPLAARFTSVRALGVWNWLGVAAMIVSGGSGILTSPTRMDVITGRKTSQPTNSFPLVLVPTIFGPVTLIAHLMALTIIHRKLDYTG